MRDSKPKRMSPALASTMASMRIPANGSAVTPPPAPVSSLRSRVSTLPRKASIAQIGP